MNQNVCGGRVANGDLSTLRASSSRNHWKAETGNRKMSAHQFSGRFKSPRVFSAYNTPFSKSRRFLTLINAFLCLRHQKEWDGKKLLHILNTVLIPSVGSGRTVHDVSTPELRHRSQTGGGGGIGCSVSPTGPLRRTSS